LNSQARRTKRLQADAIALALGGDTQRALEKLTQLELLEPREPDWPRRAAECHRLLGESELYLEALARAANAYVAMGLVVKAIAICKMMLAVNPRHPAALTWMSQLHGPLGVQAVAAPRGAPSVLEASGPKTSEKDTPTAAPQPSAARSLVAKKGLVAVARMVARKAPRTAPKSSSIGAEGPPLPPPANSLPTVSALPTVSPLPTVNSPAPASLPPATDGRQLTEEVESLELPGPDFADAPADASVVSSPPISVDAELHLLFPGSRELPGNEGTPSGMFRLAIDADEPSAGEQAFNQAQELLPAIPLFAEMDPHSLEGLVRQSRLMHVQSGEVVFKQDDPPDCLYVVVNGSVALFDDAANLELFRVGENEFFGEGALIGSDPQPATARAAEDCDLLAFTRDSMRACIVDNLGMVPVLLRLLRARMLEHLVRTSPLFTHLHTAERRSLTRKFQFIEVSEGALLIQQGTRSSGLFVLLSGAVDVIRCDGDREQWLATLERGGMFGEISLLGGSVAEADVRSVAPGLALMLPAEAFRDVIMSHPPLLEVLSAMSEERKRANERRLRPETDGGARRSPSG